jgi:hypothetical protein
MATTQELSLLDILLGEVLAALLATPLVVFAGFDSFA